MPVPIELLITAQDNSIAALGGTARAFDDLQRRAATTTQTFSQTGRQVRILAGEVSSELSPALGGIVQRATQAGSAVGGMGGAMAAATTVLVVAATALAAYIRNLNETADRQAQLNLAVRSFDGGPIRSQLQGISQEMEKLNVLNVGVLGRLEVMMRKVTDAVGFTTAETKKLGDAQAALARVIPLEREQMIAEVYGKQQQALQGLLAVEVQRDTRVGTLEQVLRLHERIALSLVEEADAENRLIEVQRKRDIASAQTRGEPQAAIDIINDRARRLQRTLGDRLTAGFESNMETRNRLRAESFERDLAASMAGVGGLEAVSVGPTVDEQKAGALLRRQLEQDLLQTDQDRARILTTIVGLTENERAAAALIAIEAERRLKFAQANGDVEKENLANLDAVIQRFNVLRAEQERLDPVAGLARGFKDAAEEAESSGKVMQDLARKTAQGMEQAFSDDFFAIITGDFKKLPDLGKQFALAMVRNITDALAQMATAPLLRSVATSLGGGGGGGGGFGLRSFVPMGAAGVGAGAGIGAAVYPGQAAAAAASPGIGVGPGLPFGSLASGGGPSFLTNVLNTRLTDVFQYGPNAAYLASQLTALGSNVPYTAADVSLLLSQGYSAADIVSLAGGAEAVGAGAAGAAGAAGGGLTAGSALGAAGAAVGFGLSLYSAYQSGSPTQGAIGGGISGALTGLQIGSMFGGYGGPIGAAIGLIVGAASGAGAGAAGKKPVKGARSAKEIRDAAASVSPAASAIAGANSFEELYTVILKYTHANFGGGRPATDPETSGFLVSFVHPDSSQRVVVGRGRGTAGPNDLRRLGQDGDLTTIRAVIQAGIPESDIKQIGQPVEQALIAKIQRLTAIEQKAFFAFRQRFSSPGAAAGGGAATYERETFYPLSRAGEAAGQDILINRDLLAGGGMTDNEIEALMRRLARVDADRTLGFINAERFAF